MFCSCVSKKKYLACEAASNTLDAQCIRLRRSMDTLNVCLKKSQIQIENLEKDTTKKHNELIRNREELSKIQDLLTSSKKELNARLEDMQNLKASIKNLQNIHQDGNDSLTLIKSEIETGLDSLLRTDSAYKNINFEMQDQKLLICCDCSIFFSSNNKNFILNKGKNILNIIAFSLNAHPDVFADVLIETKSATSSLIQKENMDKNSIRASTISHSLIYDKGIASERIQSGIMIIQESGNINVRFVIHTNSKKIFDNIKNL